ncbi:MAG: metallopeptidase family protein [Dehalococcoidia bacterium]|nr:metallopeptidase family protein [Dehalococcoidia bacterium]MCA9825060.1 metallopeptidase family protein [Dehalococcoidia bacterium]MCA9844114.1 metallopeptidase family protein [Dehalococcoidia bacterium]MCA9852624.1 metallopeptidase family protein [Dehalococcoidia bacterium]
MERAHFRRLVREALDEIPDPIRRQIHNVDLVIEDAPGEHDLEVSGIEHGHLLLGLYHGVPLTARGENYNLVLPDRISIYQDNIEAVCNTDDEVREQVRVTVLHEIGHYFGIDDDRLHELGMA